MPILGVCLGHQSIGAAFGGKIVRAPSIMHGKLSDVSHDAQDDFPRLEKSLRRHALSFPGDRSDRVYRRSLIVSAQTADGVIMAVRHKTFPVEGVQFHPESILAEEGKTVAKKFPRLPLNQPWPLQLG